MNKNFFQNKTDMLTKKFKLHNVLGVCLLIATITIITYSYHTAKELVSFSVNSATNVATDIAEVLKTRALEVATDQLIAQANAKAFQIQVELEEALGVARTLAGNFAGMKSGGFAMDVGRDSVNSMLNTILNNNESFAGVYTVWEPDKFDMIDLAYAGSKGHDETGRFIPYWHRTEYGKIGLLHCKHYENSEKYENGVRKGEYYLAPRETGTPQITNPYPHAIGEKPHWIISVVAPVMVDNAFMGIVGVDIRLNFLQVLAEEVDKSLYSGKGEVMVISQNGIIAASSEKPDSIGRHIKTISLNWKEMIAYIASGKTVNKIDNKKVLVFTPLKVGMTETLWSVHIIVSEEVVQTDAEAIYHKMMQDVTSLGKSLNIESRKAIWKQMSVGAVLVVAALFIVLLIQALEKKEKALKTLNEELEDRVEERTAELAESNAKLSKAMKALWGEMELAKKIQTSLLPELSENIHPDMEIAASMLPAEQVGGDFYDITLDRSGNLWFAIGDVSGHGVTPGLIMMMAQTIHTTLTVSFECDARGVVVRLNEILYMNVHERLNENHFMTFTALKYLGAGKFEHAGAHLRIIVYRRKSEQCELIRTKGVYLNLKKDISKATKNLNFELDKGDIMLLYTDGLTEAENPAEEMLGIRGLTEIVKKHAHQDPEAMRENIMAEVIQWCDNKREDDMSLVIVKRKGGSDG